MAGELSCKILCLEICPCFVYSPLVLLQRDVGKDEFMGEYTGEAITHVEAEKRGKLYDLANSSFIFDLNDRDVLDSLRMGNKLKFANHSANPNCYAKIMMVAGDHRVGIYSKEPIKAGQELFFHLYLQEKRWRWFHKQGSKEAYA